MVPRCHRNVGLLSLVFISKCLFKSLLIPIQIPSKTRHNHVRLSRAEFPATNFAFHFTGFKLVTSTHVLSIPDVFQLSPIPQALRFHYYVYYVWMPFTPFH